MNPDGLKLTVLGTCQGRIIMVIEWILRHCQKKAAIANPEKESCPSKATGMRAIELLHAMSCACYALCHIDECR